MQSPPQQPVQRVICQKDMRVMLTDADGKNSYPICGFTWLLIYENPKDKTKAKEIAKFLEWALTKGQAYAKDLYYAALPGPVQKRDVKQIHMIRTK